MLEIIQDILTAETKAEEILTKAKEESAKIRAEADRSAEEILRRQKDEARSKTQNTLEDAKKKARDKTEAAIAGLRDKISGFDNTHNDEIEILVQEIIELVASTRPAEAQ